MPVLAGKGVKTQSHLLRAAAFRGKINLRTDFRRPKGTAEVCISGFMDDHANKLLYSARYCFAEARQL